MRLVLLASLVVGIVDHNAIQQILEQWFYPGLLGILVIASLGLPIPEDIPLIAAGVILKLHPQSAAAIPAFLVALLGIMSGDLVLYTVGRWWGNDVVKHKSVSWIITPQRYERAVGMFRKYGMWFCFFGRFIVGIRAVMCMTAGATRFPYWKFFIADFSGALLSIPLFMGLGYLFADTLAELYKTLAEVQGLLFVLAVVGIGLFVWYEWRQLKKKARERAETKAEDHPLASKGQVTPTPASGPVAKPNPVESAAPRPRESVKPQPLKT